MEQLRLAGAELLFLLEQRGLLRGQVVFEVPKLLQLLCNLWCHFHLQVRE
jgi:hypothetical protein